MDSKLDKLFFGCLLLLAAAIPLSIGVAEAALFLALTIGLVTIVRDRRQLPTDSPYLLPIILFVGLGIGSVWLGSRPEVSLGRIHRLAFPGLILLLGVRQPNGNGWPEAWLWRTCAAFLLGVAALGLVDMVRIPFDVNRGVSWFDTGNMRDPQIYLVGVCLLCGLWLVRDLSRWRPFFAIGLFTSLLGLVLHFKRGVWISLVISLLLFVACSRRWVVLAGILVLAGVAACLPPVQQRIGDIGDLLNPAQGGRFALWTEVAPGLIAEHPLGLGWGAVRHEDLAARTNYLQPKLNHLHNNVLQITAELGWLGLSAWLLWMGTALVVLGRGLARGLASGAKLAPVRLGLLCGFVGLLANGMVEYNFGDSEILLLLCLVMGWSEWIRVHGAKRVSST